MRGIRVLPAILAGTFFWGISSQSGLQAAELNGLPQSKEKTATDTAIGKGKLPKTFKYYGELLDEQSVRTSKISSKTGTANAAAGSLLTANGSGGVSWSGTIGAAQLTGVVPVANGGTGSATQNFVDLTSAQTIAGAKTFASTITGNVTGNVTGDLTGNVTGNVSGTAGNVTGVVAVANGGTGSVTQNFVDLTTDQTIAGAKTFSSSISGNVTGNVTGDLTGNVTGNVSGTAANVTGVVAVANGGTGSVTQNFVDLTADQDIEGLKVFRRGFTGLLRPGAGSPTQLALLDEGRATIGVFGIAGAPGQFSADADTNDVVVGTTLQHKLLLQSGTGKSNICLTSNGSVGIGTNNPVRGKLEVVGSVARTVTGNPASYLDGTGVYIPSQGVTDNAGQFTNTSIFADGIIASNAYIAFSDARIKNIKGRSDGAADLKTLQSIEITDYTHKDQIEHGNRAVKKVIAQQVASVYPQAITKYTKVVPDIYKKAGFSDGWAELKSDLKTGDRVRLTDNVTDSVYPVLEVRDGAFRTAFTTKGKEVFVYGREVNDFHAVDYEALSMLNVSATQELAKQLTAKDAQIEALKKQVSELQAKDRAREDRLARIEKALLDDSPRAVRASFQK